MPPMSSLLTVSFLKKQVRQQWYKFVKKPFEYAANGKSSLLTVNFLKKQVHQQWHKFVKKPFEYATNAVSYTHLTLPTNAEV